MTIKFHRTDDGSVIDGKTVVFLPTPAFTQGKVAPVTVAIRARAREESATAQAAALVAAAKEGVPFCEECEKARKALLAAGAK